MSLKRPQSDEPLPLPKGIKLEKHNSTTVKNEHDEPYVSPAVKSKKMIRKDINSLMSVHAVNAGDFATGNLLSDLEMPCIPLIDIKNFGILTTPLTKLYFDHVKQHCQDSPYGLGEATIIDKSVRNSLQLNPDMFEIKNTILTEKIAQLIENEIKPKLGLKGSNIFAKLYKLLIYETGGKFDEHRDTEKEHNMFGTLILQLPSIFTGGNIVIKHNKNEKVYENSRAGSSTHCMFVAHYSSCPHTLEEVTSGHRVALVYSLCWDGNGMKPSAYIASTNTVKLCNLLNEFMDSPGVTFLSWVLEYEYSDASLSTAKGAPSFFKGADKNVLLGLTNALAYDKLQYGKDRYEIYIATANKHVQEYGNCNKEGYRSRYGRGYDKSSCDEDCFNKDDETGHNFNLNGFVPLTETSLTAKKLNFKFSPHRDVLNYSNKCDSDDDDDSDDDAYDKDFWDTKDHGTGCSGPTGNQGATRERWYKKKVIVLWRSDRALAMKLKSGLPEGVDHVLQLINHNELEEAKTGLDLIWPSVSELREKELVHLVEISTALKRKDYILVLFSLMHKYGISSEEHGKVIGMTANQFFSDSDVNSGFIDLLKKCKKSQAQNILYCCNLVSSLQPTEVIQTLAQIFTSKKDINPDRYYGYGYYSYGRCSSDYKKDDEVMHLIEYMFQKSTFPEKELNTVLDGITSLQSLSSLISIVIAKKDVIVINKLIARFVELASSKTAVELQQCLKTIAEMITLFQSQQKSEVTRSLLDRILPNISDSNIMIEFIEVMSAGNQEKGILKRLLTRFIVLEFPNFKLDTFKLVQAFSLKQKNLECLEILISSILSCPNNKGYVSLLLKIMIHFVEDHKAHDSNQEILKRLVQRYADVAFHSNSPVNFNGLSGHKLKTDTIKLACALRVEQKYFECLEVLINGILSHSDNNQILLQELVAHVTPDNKENLPDCLMKACRARLTHLEGVALKGKPEFTWIQPEAVVTDHPRVQEFLRGPREKLVYRNFSGLPAARNWQSRHSASRCYMTITVGSGHGKNAFVEIVKTKQGYENLVSVYNKMIVEYKRLVNVVPGYSDVTSMTVSDRDDTIGVTYSKVHDVITLD